MANDEYYNRYFGFEIDGEYKTLPFIQLDVKDTDYIETYIRNKTRLDVLSERYYDSPYYTWLILNANPTMSGLEFMVQDGYQIRIPYPLEQTLREYNDKLKVFKQIYGI
jgi:hypothetical protein